MYWFAHIEQGGGSAEDKAKKEDQMALLGVIPNHQIQL